MLSILPGLGLVFVITVVAGIIAYIGDRVGHQVGRKRLTLFGLRPKYTSTIVAVATGMLIALSVTLAALAASNYVRTAFFRIGQLSSQINELQAQAASEQHELDTTRNAGIAIQKGTVIGPYADIDVTSTPAEQERALSLLFDDAVRTADRLYAAPLGLQPIRKHASDADVQREMDALLRRMRSLEEARGAAGTPILFVPVAPANLFRGETLSIEFGAWIDRKLVSRDEVVASDDVEGGRPISAIDYQLLARRAFSELGRRDFPPPFFTPQTSGFDMTTLQQASNDLARVHGKFRLVARSETDVYPHTGGFLLSVGVEPAR